MVTKTCQPGSIYLQTWIRSPTQMPLDIQTTNFSTPDWGPRFRGLEAATVRRLPLWRGVPLPPHSDACVQDRTSACQPRQRVWCLRSLCIYYAGRESCWLYVEIFRNSQVCNTEKPNLCLNLRSMAYFFGKCFTFTSICCEWVWE